jgi:hypothetical protein
MAMMTVGEAMKRALATGNAGIVEALVDGLRMKHGMTYRQVLSLAQRAKPDLTAGDWEDLMYQDDAAGSADCPY